MVQKLKSNARQKIIEAITGRKTPFTSVHLHYETKLPIRVVSRILDELEKEGKVKGHE